MKHYLLALIPLLMLAGSRAGSRLTVTPETGIRSFAIAFDVNLTITEELTLRHRNLLFNTNYSFDHYVWYNRNMTRNNLNAITDVSYLQWKRNHQVVRFGRMFSRNTGELLDLLLSPKAPATDQFYYQFTYKKFRLDYRVGQLDNRTLESGDNGRAVYHRYFYNRKLSFALTDKLEVTFQEFIVSTGVGRNIEFYYLTPLGLLFAEEIHEEPQNVRDSDNGFLGFGWNYRFGKTRLYNEWIIDEFQIDPEDQAHRQNVFGVLGGFSSVMDNFKVTVEYGYASPWLYLHSGPATTPERHGLPLGLRSPHSQSVDVYLKYNYEKKVEASVRIHEGWIGEQDLTTEYDPVDHKIDYFNFKERTPVEFRFQIRLVSFTYRPYFAIYQNWLQSDSTDFLVGFSYGIDL
ncbi:MAG: hypothetical protein GXO91_10400 [FCB group bacterium]|nr:hypothetical protein [FCB group bacterium]